MGFRDEPIRSYMVLSVISFPFNPLFSLISIWCSSKVGKQDKNGNRKKAIFYSDIAFGLAYMAVVTTVLIIVLTYAFGKFPAHTYYDRMAIIGGRGAEKKTADDVVNTTVAAVVEATTAAVKATTMAVIEATTSSVDL